VYAHMQAVAHVEVLCMLCVCINVLCIEIKIFTGVKIKTVTF
jgi:hypothetical protein